MYGHGSEPAILALNKLQFYHQSVNAAMTFHLRFTASESTMSSLHRITNICVRSRSIFHHVQVPQVPSRHACQPPTSPLRQIHTTTRPRAFPSSASTPVQHQSRRNILTFSSFRTPQRPAALKPHSAFTIPRAGRIWTRGMKVRSSVKKLCDGCKVC